MIGAVSDNHGYPWICWQVRKFSGQSDCWKDEIILILFGGKGRQTAIGLVLCHRWPLRPGASTPKSAIRPVLWYSDGIIFGSTLLVCVSEKWVCPSFSKANPYKYSRLQMTLLGSQHIPFGEPPSVGCYSEFKWPVKSHPVFTSYKTLKIL